MKNWFVSLRAFRMSALFQKRFYRQSLILILLAICIPTVLVGSGVKWIGTRQMESIVLSSRQHQAAESALRLDNALANLEKTATQWAFNPDFGLRLKGLETRYDYEFIRNLYTYLLLIKESNPLIDQANLYLDRTGDMYSDSNGTYAVRPEDRGRFHELLNYPQTTFWLTAFKPAAYGEGGDAGALTLVYQLPANSDAEPLGVLLVHVKRSQISQLLSGSTLDENGVAFLLDEAGNRIGSSSETEAALGLQNGLIERIRTDREAVKNPIYETDRQKYLVTHSAVKRLGKTWSYVSIDALAQINSPVVAASYFVYVFGASVLLLAVLSAFFVSRRLYQPIRTLIDVFRTGQGAGGEASDEIAFITEQWKRINVRSRVLEERLEQQLPVMKEGFLLQLLQGHFQYAPPAELKERMQLFGLGTDGTRYTIIGIQLSGVPQSAVRFREGDQELISFAAVNIIEELLKDEGMRCEIVNLHDLSIGLILSDPQAGRGEAGRGELRRLAERLADALHQFLRMPVTLCVGSPIASAVEMPQAWEEAKRLVRYRDLYEEKQVIQAEDFNMSMSEEIRYPFAAESEIVQAVRNLDEKGAASALELFCRELQANTTKEYLFQQGLLQLLGNLRFVMLKAGYNPFESEPFTLQEEMERGIGIPEITALFLEKIIRPYMLRTKRESEDQHVRVKLVIERILDAIHERFGDADLSLDGLADEHDMTPLALSKAFKKAAGINFVQYLTDVRLRRSKELLADTDDKINDIAEAVGYQPTYFNRIFKKSEGITPSQFRELMQESGRD
ncbi:helix-turn-helix domain-containing protein [Paenibacillus puerhi]|uniref:helix-turn-helix domain-containing protein n=1 Tax=Paenibacillus puerhi TaxID=2692622 RepID=UPI00135882B6|nr:helix-turn-helix domain-containing protein [Paenibacillus puerhi]